MLTWTTGQVIANGITIHYHRTGGNKPTVVLAHGITDNGLCWTRVARALQQDYDVIMPDARGHGLSSPPVQGNTVDDLAMDLAEMIQALKIQPTAIVGHSMGAATAAITAAHRPDLVNGLVLEDPSWRNDESDAHRAGLLAFRDMLLERRKVQLQVDLAAFGHQMTPTWAEEEFGPWAESKFQFHPGVFDLVLARSSDWNQIAKDIRVPTLLITADVRLGSIVTPDVAQQVTTWNNHIQTLYIPEAGHNIRREQFERYIQAVRQFLWEHAIDR